MRVEGLYRTFDIILQSVSSKVQKLLSERDSSLGPTTATIIISRSTITQPGWGELHTSWASLETHNQFTGHKKIAVELRDKLRILVIRLSSGTCHQTVATTFFCVFTEKHSIHQVMYAGEEF